MSVIENSGPREVAGAARITMQTTSEWLGILDHASYLYMYTLKGHPTSLVRESCEASCSGGQNFEVTGPLSAAGRAAIATGTKTRRNIVGEI